MSDNKCQRENCEFCQLSEEEKQKLHDRLVDDRQLELNFQLELPEES